MSERDSVLTERVTAALAHGEILVTRHQAGPGHLRPSPRFWQRPRVFPGQRMPGDRLANFGLGLLRIVGPPWNVVEALMERLMWNDGPRKGAVSGGWESEAGRLALAMRPCSRTGVSLNLVVTNSHYRLVYVQTAQIGSRVGSATECGWAADLYQALAYATVLGPPEAHLVYAAGRQPERVHEVRGAAAGQGVRLYQHSLDLDQSRDQRIDRIRQLAGQLAEPAVHTPA